MLFWSFSLVVLTANCLAADIRPKQSERSVRISKPDTNKPVVFPTDDENPTAAQTTSQANEPIPESVLIRMRDIQTTDQFFNFLGPHAYGSQNPPSINGSLEEGVPINGSGVNDTSNGVIHRKGLSGTLAKGIAQAAGCEVVSKAVELERPDPSTLIWPSCTKLDRCSGCCTSSLLECVPTKTSKIEINVLQAQYKGGKEGKFSELKTVKIKVEKHEKCKCQCVQKPEHCTRMQTYRVEECKCICTNVLSMKSCTGADHVWDPLECRCKCKDIRECSTGFFYSEDNCKCEVARSSRIGSRRSLSNNRSITIKPTTTTTTTRQPQTGHLGGDFGAPLAHLSGGERSKFDSETHVNIKPYDAEPFTLAQTRRARKGRPAVRVDVSSSDKSGKPGV